MSQRSVISPMLVSLLAMSTAAPAVANHIQTAAQLRDACEVSPDHVVALDHPTKVFSPQQISPEQVQVASGCTLVLGPDAKLHLEWVSMDFAGPLTIQSAHQTEVKLTKSLFRATSITLDLAGAGSAFASNQSTLDAASGSLRLALGDESKMEIGERLLSGSANGLYAANMIQISGGRKFFGLLNENNVRAEQGISVTMDSGEGLLTVVQVHFATPQGSIMVTGSGPKNLLAISESNLLVRDAVSVRFGGSDSAIMLKQSFIGRPDGNIASGGVTLEAGSGSATNGRLELSEVGIADVASVTMLASRGGQKGALKLEKNTMSAIGDVVLETGSSGVTEVKENQLASETRIRIAAGPRGTCLSEPNEFFATPIVEACR